MTNFPASIDDIYSLPQVIDNSTPVDSTVINSLRDAILAIEEELGVKPSGTSGTVRARFEELERLLDNLHSITLTGDLGGSTTLVKVIGIQGNPVSATSPTSNQVLAWNGTTWTPTDPSSLTFITFAGDLFGTNLTQTVIGLQNNPVAANVPTSNQVLAWDGYYWKPTTFSTDLLAPPYTISLSVNPSVQYVETGSSVVTPSFTATYSNTPVTAFLTDSEANPAEDFIGTPYAFSTSYSYTKTTPESSVSFTLTSSDGSFVKMSLSTITWLQKVYWGVGPAGGNTGAFITGLSNSVLSSTKNINFSANALSTEKIYFAYRTPYGSADFVVNDIAGGFSLVSTAIPVTNLYGVTENYTLYESDQLGLGLVTITVV